jgi:hypothetical protein
MVPKHRHYFITPQLGRHLPFLHQVLQCRSSPRDRPQLICLSRSIPAVPGLFWICILQHRRFLQRILQLCSVECAGLLHVVHYTPDIFPAVRVLESTQEDAKGEIIERRSDEWKSRN